MLLPLIVAAIVSPLLIITPCHAAIAADIS